MTTYKLEIMDRNGETKMSEEVRGAVLSNGFLTITGVAGNILAINSTEIGAFYLEEVPQEELPAPSEETIEGDNVHVLHS